jgi:predicted transcriptional regulator
MGRGDKAVLERIQSWPVEDQEELAQFALEIESRRSSVYRLSEEERTAVRAGMEAARSGDFATEEEIEAFYQLHRRV